MIQRPRNRQGRPQQGDRSRGRGRGQGRGASHGARGQMGSSQNVPGIDQVTSGAPVSIILKIDQPTGREVQGIVAEVLTNGNHPRGIKVRLVDGRVGRVQRMVSEDEGKAGSAGLSGLDRNGGIPHSQSSNMLLSDVPSSRVRLRYRDIREEVDVIPRSGYSLEDFLPAGHPLREDSDTEIPLPALNLAPASEALVCPVCGQFEGDETAISHHVATHFD
ncbi:hypothetical protein B7463_g3915, partial [Scytalidium lignicola]